MWHHIELADPDDLIRKLTGVGQKLVSEDPSNWAKAPPKAKEAQDGRQDGNEAYQAYKRAGV
jgi:hypothetical protein